MRRAVSVILFIVGAWVLASGLMITAVTLNVAEPASARLVATALLAAVSAPFLLLGALISPGNRLAELGVTLIAATAVGAGIALVLEMISHDPGFTRLMPPDKPVPRFDLAPEWGIAAVLLVGGGGFLLRRWALRRARAAEPDLEQVFGGEW